MVETLHLELRSRKYSLPIVVVDVLNVDFARFRKQTALELYRSCYRELSLSVEGVLGDWQFAVRLECPEYYDDEC